MSTIPADRPGHPAGRDSQPAIDVMFHLEPVDAWPPYPAETVAAVLVGPDEARVTGIPMYVEAVSRGDIVAVTRDGAGFVAGPVLRRGGHTTVRVVAADTESLDQVRVELADLSGPAGETLACARPPVLVVDVPPTETLHRYLDRLDRQVSQSVTYVVACRQHAVPALVAGAADLAGLVRGTVVWPGDPSWDLARQAWNLAIDQRPDLVVEVADPFDVQAVIRYAAAHGLRVAPQSTGHNAAPLGDLSGTILLRTGRMNEVVVDADARSVRVGAGAVWADVSAALAPYGLAALAGSSPDVGVAGYALGGGYSWLGRRHGLASSSVTAVELVTADGTFHRVDADHEPELFWAVRGGGANVGVACALEMDVYPIPTVYAGALMFPLERAAEILPAYRAWTKDLDEAATTCVRLLRLPPLPDLPEPLRGKAFVMIDGAIDAPVASAMSLLEPLRTLGPAVDTFGELDSSLLSTIHLDPPEPVPAAGDGLSLADLTPGAIDALLALAGPDVDSPLLTVDIRHAGGALGRHDTRGGVVDRLPGEYLLFAVGIAPTPQIQAVVHDAVAQVIAAMQPWAAERDYINFREVVVPSRRLHADDDRAALRRLRRRLDPTGVLLANHPVE